MRRRDGQPAESREVSAGTPQHKPSSPRHRAREFVLQGLYQHLVGGHLLGVRRSCGVDRAPGHVRRQRRAVVDDVADDVQQPAQHVLTYGHLDGATRVDHARAAHQAVGRLHRDAPGPQLAEVLLDLQDQAPAGASGVRVDLQRVVDGGQLALLELDVHHHSDDLFDPALVHLSPLQRVSDAPGQPPTAG